MATATISILASIWGNVVSLCVPLPLVFVWALRTIMASQPTTVLYYFTTYWPFVWDVMKSDWLSYIYECYKAENFSCKCVVSYFHEAYTNWLISVLLLVPQKLVQMNYTDGNSNSYYIMWYPVCLNTKRITTTNFLYIKATTSSCCSVRSESLCGRSWTATKVCKLQLPSCSST